MQLYVKSEWLLSIFVLLTKTPAGMGLQMIRKISVVGAGNLATNLAVALYGRGFEIVDICNRNKSRGETLARKVQAGYSGDLQKLSKKSDLIIVSVSDDVLEHIAGQIRAGDRLIVHTSGSVDISVLHQASKNFGVLYPLYTFSKSHPAKFGKVPFCIEANRKENLDLLLQVAHALSENVCEVNSEQRRLYHLSAVFASNFPNFMHAIAQKLVDEEGLDFNLLKPIIKKTKSNINSGDIFGLQTGPAVRGDSEVMKMHLKSLSKYPEFKKMYELISASILHFKQKGNEL
jgi:predicted short-subunit dehydrogenase-like oxidoreductase (DUF2520 family)